MGNRTGSSTSTISILYNSTQHDYSSTEMGNTIRVECRTKYGKETWRSLGKFRQVYNLPTAESSSVKVSIHSVPAHCFNVASTLRRLYSVQLYQSHSLLHLAMFSVWRALDPVKLSHTCCLCYTV